MLTIYPWQQQQWQLTGHMFSAGRRPHALLLSGNTGIGLQHFADCLALKLLCLEPDPVACACGHCQSCRLFLAGNHPDFDRVEPEETGKNIKIDQIRDVIAYVSLKSFTNKFKIVVVEPADAMNRAAANALLKTLEEPPEQSILLLLSHYPDRLPVTVLSRCQRIQFPPANKADSFEWIYAEHGDVDAELMLHLSQGGPLQIADIIETDVNTQRQELLKDMAMLNRAEADAVQLANRWQNYGGQVVMIWLMRFLKDMIAIKLSRALSTLMNIDLRSELERLSATVELTTLVRNYDFLFMKYQQSTLPMNYNSLSLLEEIVLNWNNSDRQSDWENN